MSHANRFKEGINIAKEALEHAIKDHMNTVDVGNKELDQQLHMQRQIVQLQSEWLLHTAKVYQSLEDLSQQTPNHIRRDTTPATNTLENRSISSVSSDEMLAKIQRTIQSQHESIPVSTAQRELTLNDDWEFTKIEQFIFQNVKYDVRTYRDLYTLFLRTMVQSYGDEFENRVQPIVNKRKKPFITKNPAVLIAPISISTFYVESNLSANAIRRNMAMIIDIFQLPLNSIRIVVIPR
ncbi:MAG: hypothetical protein FJ040_12825 [Chloroflexi bacterium]|nr:hypothetical protein [Chloroflexota bacterium]